MLWSPQRQYRFGCALLTALFIAFVVILITDTSGSSMVKSGDFPGFYVLAEILKRGQADRLYDPELQSMIENELWPSFKGSFYMSVYPPYTAAILRPLAEFSQGVAQGVWTSFMLFCLLGAFFISTFGREDSRSKTFCLGLLLVFTPVMSAILGGQNTGLSMFIIAACCVLLEKGGANRHYQVGLLLGLWLVKPQFGVFAILVFGLAGPWPILASASAVAVSFYLLGASISGYSWPLEWPFIASRFGEQNFISNRAEMISLAGSARALSYELGFGPGTIGWSIASWTSLVAAVAVFLETLKVVHLSFRSAHEEQIRKAVLLFATSLPLISPQTLFYDLGIPLAVIMRYWSPDSDCKVTAAFLVIVYAAIAFFVRSDIHLPFFFPLSLGLYLWARRSITLGGPEANLGVLNLKVWETRKKHSSVR